MTAGQRTGALIKLSDRRAEWGGKSKTRSAIKCASHYHRKAIRTRADHAGDDRTGASPGSPVGEGHTPLVPTVFSAEGHQNGVRAALLTDAPLINQERTGGSPERGKSSFNLGNEVPRFDSFIHLDQTRLFSDATPLRGPTARRCERSWRGVRCRETAASAPYSG